jgi:uroporphyrin-III C-methyltransferase
MNDPRADEHKEEQERPAELAADRGEEPSPQVALPGAAVPTARPEATAGRSMGVVLGIFALLIAFAAAGGVVFTWWQVTEQREEVASQRAEAAERLANVQELVASTEERLAAQEARVAKLNSDAEERRRKLDGMDSELRQARARLEALAKQDAGPERAPSLAEIEFLLLLAGRELALAENPRVALAALREADERVARLDDPGLAEVRAAINDEIAAVEAVAGVDLEGTALRLASLARRVDGLPLRGSLAPDPRSAADADTTGWDRLLGRVRAAGTSLFRIRRTDAPAAPLLAPDESFFLYRNVELDLKSARLAVLARDRDNYAASLGAAHRALNQYFETSDEAVRSLIAAIETLEGREIAPEWPEISRSLALLRSAGANN